MKIESIPRGAYLSHALTLKPAEVAAIASFASWLPDRIVDCHAHCNRPEHARSMEAKTHSHMLSTFPSFTLEESAAIKELMYPGKRVSTLRFAKTFRGVAHREANEYLLAESPPHDRIALFGLPEDIAYTNAMLAHPRVSALKMYYSYVEPTATTIYGFFRPEILEVAQQLDIPIVLHLPLRITRCGEDLHRLISDFPRLRIALAHLGLPKTLVPGLADAYRDFSRYEQVFMDTAMCPSGEVVEASLRAFGEDRIMFGSDEPLHLIRSTPYQHPEKGERIVADYPYHWVDPEEHERFGHLAADAIHCHWSSLSAIREAVEAFPEGDRDRIKQKVLCDNAAAFYGF